MNKLRQEIEEIFNLYKKCGVIKLKDPNRLVDYNGLSIKADELLKIVEHILSLLSVSEREIIMNNFLTPAYAKWWQDKYSRATYYRIFKCSCLKFIDLMNA